MAGGRGTAASAVDEDVDHYAILCLPSGEEGARLTLKEIEKAYRNQSRIRHPDKRPDDPNATADFQRLKTSFEVLKDEAARRVFDARLRTRRERVIRDSALYAKRDAKRRKLGTDLEERERAWAAGEASDPAKQEERREKEVAARLQEELAHFKARKVRKPADAPTSTSTSETSEQEKKEKNGGAALDKERMLKVTWERNLGDYTVVKLREIFERFGGVEDVLIRSKASKRKGSALIVMSSKDGAVTATHTMCGDLSNPLLVLPVQAAESDLSDSYLAKSADPINNPSLNKIIGAGFQDYEASIMKKLQKASLLEKNTS